MYKNKLLIILFSILIIACNNNPESENANSENTTQPELLNNSGIEAIIEVYNIHTSNPDSTSLEVGTYSKKTIERFFSKENSRGIVKFIDINFDDSTNKDLINKFEITNPGLYIVCKKKDKESIENLTDFAFLTADDEPEILMQAIKTNIDDKLKLNK